MAQTGRKIVRSPDVMAGEPRTAGRRIAVWQVAAWVEDRGLDPAEVAARHDLDVADVERALDYYREHPAEMREVEAEREVAVDAHRADSITGPGDVE